MHPFKSTPLQMKFLVTERSHNTAFIHRKLILSLLALDSFNLRQERNTLT